MNKENYYFLIFVLFHLPLCGASLPNGVPIFITDNNAFTFSRTTQDIPQKCESGYNLWLDLFVDFASQKGSRNENPSKSFEDFHYHTRGIALGWLRDCGSWALGINAFYSRDHFHESRHLKRGRIVSIALAPSAQLQLNSFFIETALFYIYNRIRNYRHLFLETAKSIFRTNQLMPHLDFGYDFCYLQTVIEPFASFDWVINWIPSIQEHNGKHFSARSSSMLRSAIGLRLSHCWEYCFGTFQIKATGGYVNKAPFKLIPYHSQNLSTWGLSAMLQNGCGYFGLITYDGEAGDGYLSNEIQLKLGMEF